MVVRTGGVEARLLQLTSKMSERDLLAVCAILEAFAAIGKEDAAVPPPDPLSVLPEGSL